MAITQIKGIKMQNNNNKVSYHIWNSEPIEADIGAEIHLDNSVFRGFIGKIKIEKGDALVLEYGTSRSRYTRSGKEFVSEFPYGKIILMKVGASCVLTEKNCNLIKFVSSSQEELDQIIETQKERLSPIITELTEQKKLELIEEQKLNKTTKEKIQAKQKEAVQEALNKMESFFKPK